MPPPLLILPGYSNSGPLHWQTLWEQSLPNARRVQQRDWERPERTEWVAALDAEIAASAAPPVLVCHSLGCLTAVHWAMAPPRPVRGALLVAPPDVEQPEMPEELRSFAPIPLRPLPFPSIVVASSDDFYATLERAAEWAAAWGARFVDAGRQGHLNSDSGLGEWPQGQALLRELF